MAKAPAKIEEKNAVAKIGGDVPAYLQGVDKSSGLQGLDTTDFIIPRIKLLQATTPEVVAHDDAKAGEFWLNVLDLPLGKELLVTPISNRKRYLLMAPMGGSPTGIMARADDGIHWKPPNGEWSVMLGKKGPKTPVSWKTAPTVRESGLGEFGTSNPSDPDSNPAATLFYEYLVYLPEHPEISPVVLSLARSAAKRARDFNGKIEFRKAPMQAGRYKVIITSEQGVEGPYFNYAFQNSGWATEDEFKACQQYAERYKDYRPADEEGAVAESAGEAAASGPVERGDL